MSNAIQKTQCAAIQTAGEFSFSPEQRKMILDSFLSGATEQEANVLLELARVRRLNPITGQIHFVKRWNAQRRAETWAAQVGIDGFRAIANRTGLYEGQDEAEVEYDAKGALKVARVKVYRAGWSRPAVGVAHFSEYAQAKKEGGLTQMWATKPYVMLAKCAEAQAFRRAFPEDLAGLYVPEEMGGDEEQAPRPTDAEGAAIRESGRLQAAKARAAAALAAPRSESAPQPTPEVQVVEGELLAPSQAAPKQARAPAKPKHRAPQIVDVAPGESEAQAEARVEAQSDEEPEPAQTPYRLMVALGRLHGMSPAQIFERATQQLGKRGGWTSQDVDAVATGLRAVK